MQVETPEVSAEKATTPAFKPGDQVTFVVVQQSGRNTRYSVKEVTLLEIDGVRATAKYRNGRKTTVLLKWLTPVGQRNALTRALAGED